MVFCFADYANSQGSVLTVFICFLLGLRKDYRLQLCGSSKLKQTFPDLDYALYGYNILRGYPLHTGHDPGFTMPIFKADYSGGRQTSDCRCDVPEKYHFHMFITLMILYHM